MQGVLGSFSTVAMRAAILAAAVCTWALVLAAPAVANETPQPTGDVAFDAGFAYWPEVGPEAVAAATTGGGDSEPAKRRIVATIVQLNLATGERRVLFTTPSHYKTFLGDVVANAGRIAFTAKTYSHSSKTPNVKRELFKAYSMAVTDQLPALLEQHAVYYRGVNKLKRYKGKSYKEFVVKSYCGKEVSTQDISELGVTLVDRTLIRSPKPCKRKSKSKSKATTSTGVYKRKAYGYAPGNPTAMAYGSVAGGPLRLRSNELFSTGEDDSVAARDVASKAIRAYPVGGYPIDIDVSADRRVAVVAERWEGKGKSASQILTIFPPAATAPVVTVPLTSEPIATAFCTDSVLQVSAAAGTANAKPDPSKGPVALTLRDFNGVVLNQVTLPAGAELIGVGCTDRTALLARQESTGVVVTSHPL